MNRGGILGGVIGLGLSAWLLESYGVGRILSLLRDAGWIGVLAVIAFHPIQILCSALGWREIAGPMMPRFGLRGYVVLRWIREAVNNLLPLAQIGGEFVVSRLLQRSGIKLASAVAGTLADLSIEMASQVVFTFLGLFLLLHSLGDSGIARYLIGGLSMAVLLLACLFGALRLGFAATLEKGLMRLGTAIGWTGATDIEGLHEELIDCFRARRRLGAGMLWHLVSWLLGGIEVCLALHFIGHDVGIGPGLIIESLGQALKVAGFAVPGALGVQEGGYIVICRLFGLSPEIALALSLLKRLREVALGILGLFFWRRTAREAAAAQARMTPEPIR